jgi:hypothetical protein
MNMGASDDVVSKPLAVRGEPEASQKFPVVFKIKCYGYHGGHCKLNRALQTALGAVAAVKTCSVAKKDVQYPSKARCMALIIV